MQPGMAPKEADALALGAAIAFREAKVGSGKARAAPTGERCSGIKGVSWKKDRQAWHVRIGLGGKGLDGGFFRAKDDSPEEVERARLAAVDKRTQLESEHYNVQVGGCGKSKKRSRTK